MGLTRVVLCGAAADSNVLDGWTEVGCDDGARMGLLAAYSVAVVALGLHLLGDSVTIWQEVKDVRFSRLGHGTGGGDGLLKMLFCCWGGV